MTIHDLPAVNATLNALSGMLLIVGYVAFAHDGSGGIDGA